MAFTIRLNAFSMGGNLSEALILFYNVHFFYQMTAIAQFVEDEEHVAYIQCNATLQVIVEVDVTAQRFPVAVESSTDELSLRH